MNIDVEKIDRLPIIIVSTPRSGSTALADYIAKAKGCTLYNQPSKDAMTLHRFFMHDMQKKDYVLKEHAMVLVKKYGNILDQPSYKIRIRRRDVFRQALSHYIASYRKQFIYFKGEDFKPDTIELNEQLLLNYLDFTVMHNREANLFRHNIDLDLYYEDLIFSESDMVATVAPLNNDELTEWAYNILKDKL